MIWLFLLTLVNGAYAETYSRSVDTPPHVFAYNVRVLGPLASSPSDPLIAHDSTHGYINKAFTVNVTNISPITQNVKITATLANLSWSSNSSFPLAIFGGTPINNPQNTTQNEMSQTVVLGPASSTPGVPCTACSRGVNFYLQLFGPVSTAVSDSMYFSGAVRYRVQVEEARGAVVSSTRSATVCIGGCFQTSGGSTPNQNLADTIANQQITNDLINGGRAF